MSRIKRSKRKKNYSVIDNTPINDSRLSWKAKGILIYLLSKPDNWQVYVTQLRNASKDGKDSTNSGIEELERLGYIARTESRNQKGQFCYDYEVYETPAVAETPLRKTRCGKPVAENPQLVNTDKLNTNSSKGDSNNIPDFVKENRRKILKDIENTKRFQSAEGFARAIQPELKSISEYLTNACKGWRTKNQAQKLKFLDEFAKNNWINEYGNAKKNWLTEIMLHMRNTLNKQSTKR